MLLHVRLSRPSRLSPVNSFFPPITLLGLFRNTSSLLVTIRPSPTSSRFHLRPTSASSQPARTNRTMTSYHSYQPKKLSSILRGNVLSCLNSFNFLSTVLFFLSLFSLFYYYYSFFYSFGILSINFFFS